MKDSTLLINPEFLKFIEKSAYMAELQIKLISYALLIFLVGDLIYSAINLNFSPIILYIILCFICYFMIRWLDNLVRWMNFFYITSIYFWILIIIKSVFTSTMVTAFFLPNIASLLAPKFLNHLSSIALIMLTMAFVFGMSVVVMDLVKETLLGLSVFSNTHEKNKFDISVKAGFTLLFFISTFIVFRYFGDSLWDLTLDLLGDAAALDLVIAVMFIAFYCKLLIKDISLKNTGDRTYNE